jgi:hypothetical protein
MLDHRNILIDGASRVPLDELLAPLARLAGSA